MAVAGTTQASGRASWAKASTRPAARRSERRAQRARRPQDHDADVGGEREHGEQALAVWTDTVSPVCAGGGCCSIAWVTSARDAPVPRPLVDAAWVRAHRDEVVRRRRALVPRRPVGPGRLRDRPPAWRGVRRPRRRPRRPRQRRPTGSPSAPDAGGVRRRHGAARHRRRHAGRRLRRQRRRHRRPPGLDAAGDRPRRRPARRRPGLAGTARPGPAPADRRRVVHAPRPWPATALVEADEVADLAATGGAVVLDARSRDRFRGDTEPVDARAGHIPGARNAPWTGNLDPATGRFLPPDELRAHFAALGRHRRRRGRRLLRLGRVGLRRTSWPWRPPASPAPACSSPRGRAGRPTPTGRSPRAEPRRIRRAGSGCAPAPRTR